MQTSALNRATWPEIISQNVSPQIPQALLKYAMFEKSQNQISQKTASHQANHIAQKANLH